MGNKSPDSNQKNGDKKEFVFQLFITGASPNSVRAINNLKQLCEDHMAGRYELQIIDVYQQPAIAAKEQIIALPLMIRKHPLPERRLIGDMSETAKILKALGLE
ncbi:MAG TPA: circadian clock KaiB family protein [Flavitalea sp.]|nr:circadian clock KaiB family protein [Flavitalea sp.]